jgi:hypothetical protein
VHDVGSPDVSLKKGARHEEKSVEKNWAEQAQSAAEDDWAPGDQLTASKPRMSEKLHERVGGFLGVFL